jgi:glycosyltransferase involved in cell wall biosynthesis
VLPAYNEEGNIVKAVQSATKAVAAHTSEYEIIVVDDGSQDRTSEMVEAMVGEHARIRLVRHEANRGYGGALRSGFEAATQEWIFLIASDNQYDPFEIDKLLSLADDADIVTGFRANRQDAPFRRFYGWAWNALVSVLFGYLSRDIDCAFKLFRRQILNEITLSSQGAMIDTQLLAGARKRGFRIRETAVTHLPRQAGHQTGGNVWVVLRALRDLVSFWWELRQG